MDLPQSLNKSLAKCVREMGVVSFSALVNSTGVAFGVRLDLYDSEPRMLGMDILRPSLNSLGTCDVHFGEDEDMPSLCGRKIRGKGGRIVQDGTPGVKQDENNLRDFAYSPPR